AIWHQVPLGARHLFRGGNAHGPKRRSRPISPKSPVLAQRERLARGRRRLYFRGDAIAADSLGPHRLRTRPIGPAIVPLNLSSRGGVARWTRRQRRSSTSSTSGFKSCVNSLPARVSKTTTPRSSRNSNRKSSARRRNSIAYAKSDQRRNPV